MTKQLEREQWKSRIIELLEDAECSKRELDEWLSKWRERQRLLEELPL